jgi:hypothetical protein
MVAAGSGFGSRQACGGEKERGQAGPVARLCPKA